MPSALLSLVCRQPDDAITDELRDLILGTAEPARQVGPSRMEQVVPDSLPRFVPAKRDVERYQWAVETLTGIALSPSDSQETIARTAQEWERKP